MPLVDKFNAQAARLLDAVSKPARCGCRRWKWAASGPNHPLYAAPAS